MGPQLFSRNPLGPFSADFDNDGALDLVQASAVYVGRQLIFIGTGWDLPDRRLAVRH